MRIGCLHVLTETVLQGRFTHLDLVDLAIRGGADTIQYREKKAETREMIEIARALQAVCKDAGVPLIVNDRVDVAYAAKTDGVHVGQDDFPVADARQLLGDGPIIGVSAGTIEEALEGIDDGADYIGFGPIYETGSKADAGDAQGLERLSALVEAVDVPVIAIGGISAATAEDVIRAGAHGVAVISAVCCQKDPTAAATELINQIRGATVA